MGIKVVEYFVAYEIKHVYGQARKYFKVVRYTDLDSAEDVLRMVVSEISCSLNEYVSVTAFNRV